MILKFALLASTAVLPLTVAMAQTDAATPIDATEQAAPATNSGEEEVVVTAQKRSQRLQDVPIAISAYTAETRQLLGLQNVQDYTAFTPGLSYSGSNDRVYVRGIGRQTNTNGSDPGVATYTDGIYDSQTFTVGASDFFLDRVEILRGPQGTLYGRNSIGGAINAITKRPTDEFAAEARLQIGSFETTNIEASASGPLSDWLRARVAGALYHQGEGYFENIADGSTEGGKGDRHYAELQLEADIGEKGRAWLKVFTNGIDATNRSTNVVSPYDVAPYPPGYITPGAGFGFLVGTAVTTGSATNPGITDIRQISTNTPQTIKLSDSIGLAGELSWDFDTFQVKYIGGYQQYNLETVRDFDNTAVDSYTFPLAATPFCSLLTAPFPCPPLTVRPVQRFIYVEDKDYTSHEINFASTDDGPVQWIAGVYYYSENFDQQARFNNSAQTELQAPTDAVTSAPAPLNPDGDFVYAGSKMKTQSIAVFGQVDWAVTDQIKLTAGLRYTHDNKEGTEAFRMVCLGCDASVSPDQFGMFTPALDLTTTFASALPAPGVSTALAFDPVTGRVTRGLKDSWEAVTGTAGIEWKPDAETLAYARYSRGYKAGGFNAGGISVLPRTDQEQIDAFEVGVKKSWGREFQINAAGYYYNYKDLQVPLTVIIPGGAQLTEFFNISESHSYGIELEAMWRPTDNLQIMANYAFAGSEIQEACCFVDGADPGAIQPGAQPVGPLIGTQQPQSLNGQELPQQTPHKIALNAVYTVNFDAGALDLSASYTWRDQTYHSVFNRSYTQTPAFDMVDLRAIWTAADESYRVIGYVKNVFDEVGYDHAEGQSYGPGFSLPGAVSQTYGIMPPRTFGLQVQLRFN